MISITSLSCLSAEDKAAFAAALHRPLSIVSGNTIDLTHSINEKKRIVALPYHLLQEKTGFTKSTNPKGYCKTHETLHPYIISSILHKVRREVTGPQFNILVPLRNSLSEFLVSSLKQINAYWTTPSDYLKIFPAIKASLGSGSIAFQENHCDACILAAISGNKEVLEALRTSSFSKRRTGGRLVEWIDLWLFTLGGEVLYEVQERSERNAHILRKLKRGIISSQNAGGETQELDEPADAEKDQQSDDCETLENWED